MSNEERLDGTSDSLLEELASTPVGRRWLLKAGLGSAVALGVGSRVTAAPAATKQKAGPRRRRETRDFHFALGHVRGVSRMRLIANGDEHRLTRHTKASRAQLREEEGGIWKHADLSRLSHRVSGVKLPSDSALVLTVVGNRGNREVVLAQHVHVPRASTRALARAAQRSRTGLKSVRGPRKRLASLGLKPSHIRSPRHIVQLDSVVDMPSTAVTIAMMHPNTATKDKVAAGVTQKLLAGTPAVGDLDDYLQDMGDNGVDWALHPVATDANGAPVKIVVNGQTTTFKSFRFNTYDATSNPRGDRGLRAALQSAVAASVTAVRADPDLGAVISQPLDLTPAAATKTWIQSEGQAPQPQAYTGPTSVGDPGLQIKVKYPGDRFGTRTVVTGGYANHQVPLTFYNNWVRWVSVYVQYLGPNDANLSHNANPTWPDTSNCKSLGVLPQIFTVLGVPIWDTNTIDATLTFPDDAHTARILFCGLGSNLNEGDWQRFFPAGYYKPDAIAPQDEVLFPAIVTGIFTIGLTAFALATDFAIETTWRAVRETIGQTDYSVAANELATIAETFAMVMTKIEAVATAIASGAATVADVEGNFGSTKNIWETLLSLATLIPKLLFAANADQFWGDISRSVVLGEAAGRLINAVPIIGELISVLELLGDAATLAEVGAETIIAPWVIENEVNLTYAATVTVGLAQNAKTWPSTATNWSLQAQIDGANVLDPIVGPVNAANGTREAALELDVTAPFGGKTIQWVFTVKDDNGVSVGAGLSETYVNDDPKNPPATVSFTFAQIQVPILPNTGFARRDATGYDPEAPGYTWSKTVTSSGTLGDKGIQAVVGSAVSTLAGAAAVVWEEGNKFYVRGVPTGQDGTTYPLGKATAQGWSRRPFLLLDPFVQAGQAGNHVLLEPDPTDPPYYVRRVTVDPVTAAPTWDPQQTWGVFPLPISAAALHPSGLVLVINTDTGRLASVMPSNLGAISPTAAYSAGPGTQPGLLSSPVAIAVTTEGVVLVLEGGTTPPQVSAFDLTGKPIPYFPAATTRRDLVRATRQTGSTGRYALPLKPASYLDLAVDGAGMMYALYYTGDGSAVADYRVDVFDSKSGALLSANASGVNVPHLSVDHWRSIFAANFDPLADMLTGQPEIDSQIGVAEPSVSRFDPVNPPKGSTRAIRRRRRKPARAR